MSDNRKYAKVGDFISKKITEVLVRNSRLSIRSICLKSGISSGRMADLKAGRRALSEFYAEKLAVGLKLNTKDRQELFSLVSTSSRKKSPPKILSEKELSVVNDWEYYAILNLLKTQDCDVSPRGIAERLMISQKRAQECVNTLLALGLIKKTEQGLERIANNLTTTWDIPSESVKEFHRRMLSKSADVIGKTAPHERHYSSVTFPIDVSKIETAKKLIDEFRTKLNRHFEGGNKTEVYNLSLQLFPLTHLKRNQDV